MKRLLTLPLLSLVLGAIFLFAPTPHAAHADGGGCAQNNNVTYSNDVGNSDGLLDLWPCISSDSNAVYSYGYASFRNTADSIYQNGSGNWYQLSGCSLTIGLIPSGGNLDPTKGARLQGQTVDCIQWVKNKSIGVALPTSTFTKDMLTLAGSYQTGAQVTLTYTDADWATLKESSPAGYSPATQISWSQTCTQSNNVSISNNVVGANIDLWPCVNINGSTTAFTVNASFRSIPSNVVLSDPLAFNWCELDVSIDHGKTQTVNCTQAARGENIGAFLYQKQFNYRSAGWSGYHTLTAAITLGYRDTAAAASFKVLSTDTVERDVYYG